MPLARRRLRLFLAAPLAAPLRLTRITICNTVYGINFPLSSPPSLTDTSGSAFFQLHQLCATVHEHGLSYSKINDDLLISGPAHNPYYAGPAQQNTNLGKKLTVRLGLDRKKNP